MPKHAQNVPDDTASSLASNHSDDERIGLTEAFSPAPVRDGAHAGDLGYHGDEDDDYPDALELLEPLDAPPLLFGEDESSFETEKPKGRHSKKQKPPVPPHQRKSRRVRKILIAIVILLILLIGALAYFTLRLIDESQTLASQQTQEQQNAQEVEAMQQQGNTKDATTTTTKKTEVPNLVAVLGMTKSEAITTLKHGAIETSSKEVNEEGNPVKTNVTVALTDEPADTRSGTPTVYLGLNEGGQVIQAGYSAATASLGYGSLSFVDAVENEHIVEKTLQEANIDVPEGTVKLPQDKATYSEYASDGIKLVKENCSFSGTVDLDGVAHEWSAVLHYNYATANTSGNLADTVRIIYVYIHA